MSELDLQELADLVLEVERVNESKNNEMCGKPCPYSTSDAYCGRIEGHPAVHPDHHNTRIDVYEYAAPKLAAAIKLHGLK